MNETPKNLGFRMPAEWEPHRAVWLAWPYDTYTFPGEHLSKVEGKFVEIIEALYQSDKIQLLVLDIEMKTKVQELLTARGVDISKIIFVVTMYADVWLRDYGPMFLKNNTTGERGCVRWRYNAYGKFPDLLKDGEVFSSLEKYLEGKIFKPNIVMEGGSIELNGAGTLITTEQCLLNKNRNSNLNKEQIEEYLKENLGVDKIIWLKDGLTNDHTDGHVDDIIKFVDANTVICAHEDDPQDPNFKILDENYKILENSVDQNGKAFKLIKLPMPHMNYENGKRAPASYTNFYIGNKVVLVPSFNNPNDSTALEIIQSCFPDRKAVQIDCTDLIYGGGALHCITQQEP